MLEKFLSGEIAIMLNKFHKAEIREFYEIVEPYINDIHYARQHDYETQLDYLLSNDTGPYHMILTQYKGCMRYLNGGKISYVRNLGYEPINVTDFIRNVRKKTDTNIEESDIDALFA